MKATIALIMMLLATTAAHAQLMKCVGKDGRVEYANQCPPGTKEQPTGIKSSAPAPASSPAPQKSVAERDAEFRKRQMEKQEADAKDAKKTAEDAQRKRACDDARAYLKTLQAGNRVVKYDPKTGERIFLEDAQYVSETAVAQRSIDANCK
ncbi:MAG: DUF4124 domain-containing protein [Betaproteobacteria bacterium]